MPLDVSKLGKYRILRRLGHGGMGEIFLAEQEGVGRKVAVKILPSAFSNDPSAVARFQREVHVLGQLPHPNICPIIDVGEQDGVHFYAMEYLAGSDLAKVIETQRITPERAADVVRQAAEALHFAHLHGVIHRDIKPQNLILTRTQHRRQTKSQPAQSSGRSSVSSALRRIFAKRNQATTPQVSPTATTPDEITRKAAQEPAQEAVTTDEKTRIVSQDDIATVDVSARREALSFQMESPPPTQAEQESAPFPEFIDHVYVIDFGLARETDSKTLTVSGEVMGTPVYMAPEQAAGDRTKVGPWTDVYALGVVMYEMLTLRKPFEGEKLASILMKVLHDEPTRPRLLKPDIPRDLETIILKCIEKETQRRYQTAEELAHDLERFLRDEPIAAKPTAILDRLYRKARRNKLAAASIAIAACLFFALAASFLGPAWVSIESSPPGARFFVDGEDTQLTTPISGKLVWPPGRHSVCLRKPGYDDYERRLTLKGFSTDKLPRAVLVKDHGYLALETEPPDAAVTFHINGKLHTGHEFAAVPPTEAEPARQASQERARWFRLPKGTHKIEVSKTDHNSFTDAIFISPDHVLKLNKALAPVTGTLSVSSNVDGVSMTASVAQASSLQTSKPKKFQVPQDDIKLEVGTWRLIFEKENHFGSERVVKITKDSPTRIRVTMQPMLLWAFQTGERVESSAAVADLDGDGHLEVVLTSTTGDIYALSGKNSKVLWRCNLGLPILCTPALVDLDLDGKLEIVVGATVCARSGEPSLSPCPLAILDGTDGKIKRRLSTSGLSWTRPAIADLDKDGFPDIVAAEASGRVFAYSYANDRELWSRVLPEKIASAPAIADLDGDTIPDVVVWCQDSFVYALSGNSGAILWQHEVGSPSCIGSPALGFMDDDEILDVVTGSNDSHVYCLSGKNGELLWKFETQKRVPSTAEIVDITGDGRDDVVVGSGDNWVYALDGRTGALLWKFETEFELWSHVSSYEISGDGIPDIFVGSTDCSVYGLSGKDGALLWRFRTLDQVISAVEIADLDEDGVPEAIFTSKDGCVYAARVRPSRLLWSWKTGGPIWASAISVELNDDGVVDFVCGSGDRYLYALSGRDGALLWKFKGGSDFYVSASAGKLDRDDVVDIVAPCDDGYVYALSAHNGRLLWNFHTEGKNYPLLVPSLNEGSARDVVVSSTHQNVYRLSGTDGALIWKFTTQAGNGLPYAISLDGDDVTDIVVNSADGHLYALSGRNGSVLWKFKTQAQCVVQLDGDDVANVVFSAGDGHLYALSGRNGSLLWRFETGHKSHGWPCVAYLDRDEAPDIVVGTGADVIYAVSGSDGSLLWKFQAAGDKDAPAVAGKNPPYVAPLNRAGETDILVVPAGDCIYALAGRDGSLRWKYKLDGGDAFTICSATLCLDGNEIPDVVAVTTGHYLYAIAGNDGALLWKYRMPREVPYAPCVAHVNADGIPDLVVSCLDGNIYALNGRPAKPLGILWSFSKWRQEPPIAPRRSK